MMPLGQPAPATAYPGVSLSEMVAQVERERIEVLQDQANTIANLQEQLRENNRTIQNIDHLRKSLDEAKANLHEAGAKLHQAKTESSNTQFRLLSLKEQVEQVTKEKNTLLAQHEQMMRDSALNQQRIVAMEAEHRTQIDTIQNQHREVWITLIEKTTVLENQMQTVLAAVSSGQTGTNASHDKQEPNSATAIQQASTKTIDPDETMSDYDAVGTSQIVGVGAGVNNQNDEAEMEAAEEVATAEPTIDQKRKRGRPSKKDKEAAAKPVGNDFLAGGAVGGIDGSAEKKVKTAPTTAGRRSGRNK